MTISISDNNPRIAYTATAGQTAFTVPFEFFSDSDLNVYINETLQTITTHYTVSGGSGSTGTVTLTSGATLNDKVVITRDVTLERTTDFPSSGPFQVSSLNTELDKIIAMIADLEDLASRGITLADSDTVVSVTLPNVTGRAGKVLAFNATTGAVEAGPTITDTQTVAQISSDISTVAGISSNVTTVAGDASDIGTVAGISSEITSVAGKASLITSDFVADLNTLGTAAIVEDLNILGTADVVSDLDTAATNITAIQNASTNANTATTKASEAATSASNALTSENNAATSETNAATSATAASASQTAAANSAAALAAALDGFDDKYLGTMADTDTASSASTTATWTLGGSTLTVADATGIEVGQNVSATGIPNQANVLSIDGTSVTISHVATAAGSGAAVTFQGYGVYGAFNSTIDGPSKDNDNGNLSTGMLYFNSTDNEMRVYDGANWIAASAAGTASLILYEYTATAGQTTFSGSDDNSATLSYTVDNLQVVMNGVVLDPADFTATNGTSVVLDSGATVGDQVNIYSFKSFTTADMVSKTAGGTFSGAVGFGGGITGDVSFDTDTLHVDSTNNRVGVGTGSPDTIAEIRGANPIVTIRDTETSSGSAEATLRLAETGASDSLGSYWDIKSSGGKLEFIDNWDEGGGTGTRVTLDDSGNVLVGTTDTSTTAQGVRVRADLDAISAVADGTTAGYFGRLTSDGEIVRFRKGTLKIGSIGVDNSDNVFFSGNSTHSGIMIGTSSIIPYTNGSVTDNTEDLATNTHRFNDAFITNGVTTGSDQNEKQQIASLTDAEIAAAKRISNGFKTFKWNDAVAAKGDNARTHTGVIAQEVRTALEAEGLDAGDYAFFMSNTWWETQTEVPAVEADEENGIEAQDAYTRTDTYETAEEAPEGATERTRLGIRYPELLAFIGAATEQRLADIETRLTALEAE